MKWEKKSEPYKGQKRIKKKFLFFPICINGECRWLEFATIEYQFEGWDYANYDCYEALLWRPIKFIG